jgi:4'-phosphopantetheinyl transferase
MRVVSQTTDCAVLRLARVSDVLQRLPPSPQSWLSPSEAERLAMLRVEPRRSQYLAGHWLLREALAERDGGQATDWFLRDCRGQAPRVEPDQSSRRVSLSHSGEWIVAALADSPIGIDLEQRRARRALLQFDDLLRAIDDPPGALSEDTLLQRWVAKEAWIKRFGGSALPDQLRKLQLRRAPLECADVRLWTLDDLHLGLACSAPLADCNAAFLTQTPQSWAVGGNVASRNSDVSLSTQNSNAPAC